MSRKHPERLFFGFSKVRRLLRAVGLLEAAPLSVRNARQRVRARRPLAGADPRRLVTA